MAVTDFSLSDYELAGRPWVILHNHRAYASYDVDTIDPILVQETRKSRGYVSVYEVRPGRSSH